jgi:hypothetical protein
VNAPETHVDVDPHVKAAFPDFRQPVSANMLIATINKMQIIFFPLLIISYNHKTVI